MKKRISILGSTGSVGQSALKVVDAMPDHFVISILACHRSKETLLAQADTYNAQAVAIGSRDDAAWLRERLPQNVRVVYGDDLLSLIRDTEVDFTLSAIVGAAGLKPTMAAIQAGSTIGLANKESMVIAGEFMNEAAHLNNVTILPVDSEHNALHQCLRGEQHDEVKRLILTASGGPFRTYDGDFDAITPEMALRHPTWDMGPKISIDSATMMNKALEIIEAHYLFNFPGDKIDAVVHPQSIVHSMIETVDGSTKAQLSKTDMVDPIQYAMTYPHRRPSAFETLDITKGLTLEFFPVDFQRFPAMKLAYDVLKTGGAAATAMNAANEEAVAAFLERRIKFTDIARLVELCLEKRCHERVSDIDELLAVDREVRKLAEMFIEAEFSGQDL